MNSYTTLMVDLDGTLLDIEVAFFLGPMVTAMHDCFADSVAESLFRESLFRGIEEIMGEPRRPGETNQEGFTHTFSLAAGVEPDEVRTRFERFYTRVFPTLDGHAHPRAGAGRFLRSAREGGYRLALATNPIFPTVAVLERLKWARVDPDLFDFIPGLETMGSCKPQAQYFADLAQRLHVHPEDCLMVGNDVQQDLPAAETGMGTFLVEGQVVDRGTGGREPDARGNFDDLAGLLGLQI